MSSGLDSEPRAQRWGRRALTLPGYVLALITLVVALPALLPLAALADLLRGSRFARTRTLLFAGYYFACEVFGLLVSLLLWAIDAVAPHPKRHRRRHYALQGLWAGLLFAGVRRLFGLHLEVGGDAEVGGGPLLVFVRHASLADTLLPAVVLSRRHGLRLRYVLKRELLWDPCLDVVGNRLPNLFVRRGSGESAAESAKVARLAQELGTNEGVLIYPEGTRFTPARRERAILRIERSGDPQRLARARGLRHVLPPRTGGPLALLEAAPDADVLLVAHVGFEGISHFRDAWSGKLIGRRIRVQLWRVPRSSLPVERGKQTEWLYDAWERIDAWIDAQGRGA